MYRQERIHTRYFELDLLINTKVRHW